MLKIFCVIEDNLGDFELAKDAINEAFPDAQILHAHGCGDIKKLQKKYAVDVFLVDYHMPHCTGYDIIKNLERGESLVVLMTGQPLSYSETFKQDIDGFCPKPVTANKLESILKGAKWLNKTSA